MPDSIDLSIVIVTWNSESEIMNCISSAAGNSGNLKTEIIIVDNNSGDDTCLIVKEYAAKNNIQVVLIENNNNSGFTRASNQGIETSSGKNVMLLNPDTIISDFALEKLYSKLISDEKIGAVAPQLLNPDKSVQYSCRRFPGYFDMFCELSLLSRIFPRSKTFARWKMQYFDHETETNVDQPMAAALMIKKSVLNEVGNFDKRYNMFFNDVDLCKSIHEKGYKIIFSPAAKLIHEKGVSIYKDRSRMINIWNEDCLKYFKKNNYKSLPYGVLKVGLNFSKVFRR